MQNAADFKIVSPICLRRHEKDGNKDWYISVADSKFEDVLKDCIKMQLESFKPLLRKYVDSLQINTDLCRKTVVWHYGQAVEATIGIISFCGEPSLLNAVNEMNLGVRKASGFGLLQVIKSENISGSDAESHAE